MLCWKNAYVQSVKKSDPMYSPKDVLLVLLPFQWTFQPFSIEILSKKEVNTVPCWMDNNHTDPHEEWHMKLLWIQCQTQTVDVCANLLKIQLPKNNNITTTTSLKSSKVADLLCTFVSHHKWRELWCSALKSCFMMKLIKPVLNYSPKIQTISLYMLICVLLVLISTFSYT